MGKYELIKVIGRGSMGVVYLARDPFSLRDVAIKVVDLDAKVGGRPARRRRKLFYNEVKAAGMLRHPNIIATTDAGNEDNLCYIVMEYVAGAQTLDVFCHPDKLLPFDRTVMTMIKCATAFDYAHSKGVIHRDIKPKNIMLTQENEVKICDFGVALLTGIDEIDQTQVLGTLGSPRYMAPEQITGEGVTNQSDIFSLGVVLYELLCGKNPFTAKTIGDVARKVTREAHAPLKDLREGIPQELIHIVERTLKKHPAGRYRVAMELAADLNLIYEELKLSEQDLSAKDKLEQLKELSFFRDFEDSDVMEVSTSGLWKFYEVGEKIIVEGARDDTFYILVDGRVALRRANQEVGVLGPGASFGEIGFVLDKERTATIVAKEPVTVLEVKANHVECVSVSCQLKFQKAFLRSMAERMSGLMNRLAPQRRRR
jgi:serine/threonine protein kinase